jgi:single stranded DNA-binding protein
MELKVMIIGRVGRDAELKEVTGGKKVCSYNVATNPTKDKTVWFKVTTWDRRAEIDAMYVKKGMLVKCEGTLQSDENGLPRTYTKDGNTIASNFEMTAYDVKYLSKVESAEQAPAMEKVEEIPF